jgi:hypothetical protein
MNIQDIDRYEDWKKNNPNGSTNEYYSFLKNKETVIPSRDNLGLKEKESFTISPMTKLFIASIIVIAILKYEYIGEKISQARMFITEKTNMVEDPDGFNETFFFTRDSELAYIREYVKYEFTSMLKLKDSKSSDRASDNLMNTTSLILVENLANLATAKEMNEVIRLNLSISQVKVKFKEFKGKKGLNENKNINSDIKKQSVTKSHAEKVKLKPIQYDDGSGKLKPLSEIIEKYYRQTATYIPERPYEIITSGSFYVTNEIKKFKGNFHIVTGITESLDETAGKIFKVSSLIYFTKEDNSEELIYIHGDYVYTKNRKINELYNTADEITNDSKSEIARIMGMNLYEIKYEEYSGD